jgi:hypothetical protein
MFHVIGSLVQDSYEGYDEKIESLITLKYSFDSLSQTLSDSGVVNASNIESNENECEKSYSRLASVQIKTDSEHSIALQKGPWNHINNILRGEIEQVSETAINYEKANHQYKEQVSSENKKA